jgi:hypothetical protein
MIDIGGLGMHCEFIDVPAGFNRSNVTCIKILLDLISVLIENLKGGSVMALVNIFMDIFDCLDRGTDLDIDVAVVSEIDCQSISLHECSRSCLLGCKIWIIRDNISIVINMEWATLFNSAAIVGSGIIWIAVWIESCNLSKFFGISFAALFVHHTFSFRLDISARTMNHAVGHSLV